jgi:hypothetical protein
MPRFVVTLFLALAFLERPVPVAAQRTKPATVASKQLWSAIKTSLTEPDGEEYFENNLKNAMVPGGAGGVTLFTGTLLSAEPAAQPSVLVVAISDSITPEVTLQLKDSEWKDTHLNGPLMRGSVIQFEGVPTAFTKKPFMLTFGVSMTQRSHITAGRSH